MTMHTNVSPMPSPPLPSPSTLPTPPSTPGKPGKVKKMVDSLKRRGSKILGRRASSGSGAGFHAASPRSPRSSPARSRSPSPTRPVHQRARTTSLVFTSLRLPRKALKRANSALSLRSDDTAVSAPSPTHVRTPSTATSFSYTRDKLSLDVDDAALSPRLPLATIVSAIEETDPAERFAVPEPAEIRIPEDEDELAPAVVEEPQPAPEAEAVVIQPVMPEQPEPVLATPAPEPEPEPVVLAPAPAPEPTIPATAPEPTLFAPALEPIAVVPAPSPFVPSWSEYDEYRDIPAFVLPAFYLPRVPVRTALAAIVPPFWTLHWWLHPLLPIV